MRLADPRSTVVLLAIAASVGGCQKSSEQQADEAAKAAVVKEQKEQKAFAELERGETQRAARLLVESQEANEHAVREADDVGAAVTRERFRVLLTKEIAWIDRRVADMERVAVTSEGTERLAKERDAASAREWGERLRQDLEALEHPPAGTDWSALKQRIERDLDENRPPSIPRSYEKSYGI